MWDWNPVSTTARSAHYHGVNDGAKRPLSLCLGLRPCGWYQRRREAPIITVSRALPSRQALVAGINDGAKRPLSRCLGLRPRGALRARGSLYESVLYNLYKKMYELFELVLYNLYKNVELYEFVCINLYKNVELYEFVCMNLYKN